MTTYTVQYKKAGSLFWHTIKNVKGDGYLEGQPVRYFILADETRIEVDVRGLVFQFSKGRHFSILERMRAESGQPIPINER